MMRILLGLLILICGCQKTDQTSSSQTEAGSKDSTSIQSENPEIASSDDTGMTLVWRDEFNGDRLDSSKWKFETGATGWGNNELQNYTAGDNVELKDGILRIMTRQTGEHGRTGAYTSTRLNSVESFQYGRMEIRAKIPDDKGKGLWPAIWMLGHDLPQSGWPNCGEIDIMEYVSYSPGKVHFAIHSKVNNHVDGTAKSSGALELDSIEEEFHVYGINWTEDKIEFFVDDPTNIKFTFEKPDPANKDNWPFDKPFYFLLNTAVGGSWGGQQGIEASAFPATFEIDYVRVYQQVKDSE